MAECSLKRMIAGILVLLALTFGYGLHRMREAAANRAEWLGYEWFTGGNQDIKFTCSDAWCRGVAVDAAYIEPTPSDKNAWVRDADLRRRVEIAVLRGRLHKDFSKRGFTSVDGVKIQ
jgi:hypothetical protein